LPPGKGLDPFPSFSDKAPGHSRAFDKLDDLSGYVFGVFGVDIKGCTGRNFPDKIF